MLEWYDFALFGFFAQQIGDALLPRRRPDSLPARRVRHLRRRVPHASRGRRAVRLGRRPVRPQAGADLVGAGDGDSLPSASACCRARRRSDWRRPYCCWCSACFRGSRSAASTWPRRSSWWRAPPPGRRGWMGSWGPLGAFAGTLLGSAAGAIVNASMSPEAVMAYGWRIPFILGIGVGLGGLAIRRHYVERVPHQAPSKSPLGEAFRSHWRTMLHLVALTAALSVGFYTTFVYAATWLSQVVGVPARTALGVNTLAMAIALLIIPAAGVASDRLGRRTVLVVGGGSARAAGLPADGADGAGADGRHHRGRDRTGSAGRGRSAARCRPRWPSWRPGGCAAPCSRWRTISGWPCSAGRRRWSRRGWSRGAE